jgi:hypothetical protein
MNEETNTATKMRIAGYAAADELIDRLPQGAASLDWPQLRTLLFLAFLEGARHAADSMAEIMATTVEGANQ